MKELTFKDYTNQMRKRTLIRWFSISIFFTITLVVTIFALYRPESEMIWITWILFILIGNILLIGIIVYPFFRKISYPRVADGTIVQDQTPISSDSKFFEQVKLKWLYYICVPLLIIYISFTTYFIIEGITDVAVIFLLVIIFLLGILILFGSMVVTADAERIIFNLGPIRTILNIEEVDTIRPVSVRPLRDYLGWGKRLGTDGSIGYIADLKTGVRIELKDGKAYVTTIKNVQQLTNLVRFFKQL
jgi:hypothetical protein